MAYSGWGISYGIYLIGAGGVFADAQRAFAVFLLFPFRFNQLPLPNLGSPVEGVRLEEERERKATSSEDLVTIWHL